MANIPQQGTQSRAAQDFIKSACRLTGTLRSGQNLTASELSDCLQVLNDMMDSWSAKRARVFSVTRVTVDQNGVVLTLKANQARYLLGNSAGTEDFLLQRPPQLFRVSILYSASQQTPVELPMDMYDDVRWQGIANKTTASILPQVCYIEQNFPDMELNFWPVPTQAQLVILYLWQQLTQFPNLQTKFAFPQGYSRAIRFNLAVELFAEFSGDPTKVQAIAKLAADAMAILESGNVRAKEATSDPALIGGHSTLGNIFTSTATRTHP